MKCFYHDDLDGKAAAAVVARYTCNYDPAAYFKVNYAHPLPLGRVLHGERVYFVDYSFTKHTVDALATLLHRGCHVIWIDHHTSSINLQEDPGYTWLKSIDGIRSDEASGAALTYMFLFNCSWDAIPYFLKLVSDYDTWTYAYDPDTTCFKLGIEVFDYDPLSDVWHTLFSDPTGSAFIDRGQPIKYYIDRDYAQYRDSFAYDIELCGYPCRVVNRKSNSWIFGQHNYPLVMTWVFDGTKFIYSIFSTDKDVDCSRIAELYGGGGHRGAAGFISSELLFRAGGCYNGNPMSSVVTPEIPVH